MKTDTYNLAGTCIYTHNGPFNASQLLAIAMLQYLLYEPECEAGAIKKQGPVSAYLGFAGKDWCIDIGQHNPDARKFNRLPAGSAKMVLKELKSMEVVNTAQYKALLAFCAEVDHATYAISAGIMEDVPTSCLSYIVHKMNNVPGTEIWFSAFNLVKMSLKVLLQALSNEIVAVQPEELPVIPTRGGSIIIIRDKKFLLFDDIIIIPRDRAALINEGILGIIGKHRLPDTIMPDGTMAYFVMSVSTDIWKVARSSNQFNYANDGHIAIYKDLGVLILDVAYMIERWEAARDYKSGPPTMGMSY